MGMSRELVIDAIDQKTRAPLRYWVLNEQIHEAASNGTKHIVVKNTTGQRFIAACMERSDLKIDIHGTPGNDLGVFMSGPTIEVFGNCEDQTGNTMNSGTIIVHGNAWDVTGLAARGGKILVRGDGGYRIGIHMKEYKDQKPVIMYGGKVKEFFGEYMAGGTLVALGMKINGSSVENIPAREVVRGSLASGIHGGAIYIRGEVPQSHLGVGANLLPTNQDDERALSPILKEFCTRFNIDEDRIWEREIVKIVPSSARPFSSYYNARPV
jgi:glutamate synthase domain-containing protein 3